MPPAHRYRGQPFAWVLTAIPGHTIDHASQIRQFITAAGIGSRRTRSTDVGLVSLNELDVYGPDSPGILLVRSTAATRVTAGEGVAGGEVAYSLVLLRHILRAP